jgi:hypothetical protein
MPSLFKKQGHVKVIRHNAVCEYLHRPSIPCLLQKLHKCLVIFLFMKHFLSPVPTVYDMVNALVYETSRYPWHRSAIASPKK